MTLPALPCAAAGALAFAKKRIVLQPEPPALAQLLLVRFAIAAPGGTHLLPVFGILRKPFLVPRAVREHRSARWCKVSQLLSCPGRASAKRERRSGTQGRHDGSLQRCGALQFLRWVNASRVYPCASKLPISGKPEIGVSLRSRKRARCTRPGHETVDASRQQTVTPRPAAHTRCAGETRSAPPGGRASSRDSGTNPPRAKSSRARAAAATPGAPGRSRRGRA